MLVKEQYRSRESVEAQKEFCDTFHSCSRHNTEEALSTSRIEEHLVSTNLRICRSLGRVIIRELDTQGYRRKLYHC